MIRLLAVDIDGTLLDGRGRLTDANTVTRWSTARRAASRRACHRTQFSFRAADRRTAADSADADRQQRRGRERQNRHDRDAARAVARGGTASSSRKRAHLRGQRRDCLRSAAGRRAQIVFARMDWSHPNRRGYYEKNRAFIAPADGPLDDEIARRRSDPGDVQRQRRADASAGSSVARTADRGSVHRRVHRVRASRLLAGRRQRRRLLERHDAGPLGRRRG